MKLIFAGTPPFAAAALSALHRAGHEICLVLTQPDRPAGRGMKMTASAVAEEASRLGLRLEKPQSLRHDGVVKLLNEIGADAMVVAAYGLLLPQAILDVPRFGCLNIHGSLLPRWRGAAPVQRAIEAGDRETGITIMQMDSGLDTGAILLKKPIPIAVDETSATLFDKLTALGAGAIVEALEILPILVPRSQSAEGATYAKKIDKSEAVLDWGQPASVLERRIRAFDPFPGCETKIAGDVVKVWRGQSVNRESDHPPGTLLEAAPGNLMVQCGEQALRIAAVQKRGGRRMAADEFLRGTNIHSGMLLS